MVFKNILNSKEKCFLAGTIILAFTVLFIFMIPVAKVEGSVTDIIQEISYSCSERGILSMSCSSLSQINNKGTQTRCYFYSKELNRLSYKICDGGWKKVWKV